MLVIVFDLLEVIEAYPLNDTDIAFHILKNFAMLLEAVLEKVENVPLEFVVKAVEIINTISYRSPPQLRLRLKDTGLPEARNAYVMKCTTSKFPNYDFGTRMAALCSIHSSIQNMLTSADTRHITDLQFIFLILGFFVEATERVASTTSDLEQELLYGLVDIQAALVELIHMAVACSTDCRRALSRVCHRVSPESEGSLPQTLYTDRSTILLSCFLNSFKSSTSDAWEVHLRESNLTSITCVSGSSGRPGSNVRSSWFSWSSGDNAFSDPGADEGDVYNRYYGETGTKDAPRHHYDSDVESIGSQGSNRSTSSFSMGFARRGSPLKLSKGSAAARGSPLDRKIRSLPKDSEDVFEDLRPYDIAAFLAWYNDLAQR
jgi:hypothetical protein